EQAEPAGGPVTGRSDVYSLGVVLYELLVGTRPHAEATDDPLLPGRIVDQDPARPSSRWRTLDEEERARSAKARALEPADLAVALTDLDWIVLKAIARQRDRRYGSVGALAADVDRYLRHEPIEARPPSLRYRLACFARRQRATVIAAGLVLLSLVLGTFGATLGMLRAREAEGQARAEALRASREAQTATRVSDLLVDLFAVADPSKGGPSTTMELGELLDRGSASIRQGLDEEPAIQARLMSVLGDIYRVVGDYDRSREHLERSLELWQADPEPDALRLGQTLNHLAVLDRNVGRLHDAAANLQRAASLWVEALGPEHPRVAGLLNNQGNVLREMGRYAEAAAALERALAIWERSLGAEDRNVGIAALNLGNVWNQLGRYEEALAYYQRAGRIFEILVGPDHPYMGTVEANTADALAGLGRYQEAEASIREALRIRRAALGPEHDATFRAVYDLGRFLLAQGKLEAAQALLREAIEGQERVHGPDHPQIAFALTELGEVRRRQGKPEEAVALAERAVKILAGQRSEDEINLRRARELLVAARSEAAGSRAE
ncbi:MAG: tetratricopeptide repeat protein, partial [Holophagales bacterium]|nr:tetratricopeptide repeat protein [Holophagales bacterium]